MCCKGHFFVKRNKCVPAVLLSILITIENFNFVVKENKESFVKFFWKFVGSKFMKHVIRTCCSWFF